MRSDPNIIANAMLPAAPQLPDVNAMMQTRTAGLENMYNLDRQQQSDAAAQQGAQEDAIVKAMTPAYAAALGGNGSKEAVIAGFNMLAPEVQASVKPQVDQLLAMGSDEMRVSALQGSLAGSAQGRAILDRIPTEFQRMNAGIQQGQLGVSQQRLVFDQQKLAAETANGPKVSFRETDAQGNVHLFDEQGNEIGVAEGAGKPSPTLTPDGVKLKPGERMTPDGTAVEAVPGSELYNKQKIKHGADYKAARAAIDSLKTTSQAVQDLQGTTDYQKGANTGALMGRMPNIPGVSSATGGYDFQTKYQNLDGAVKAFGRSVASLQGKLGNMAVQEWKMVSDSIASLDLKNMDAATLNNQLDRIATQLQAAESTLRDAYDQEYGGTQFYAPLPDTNAGAPTGGGATQDTNGDGTIDFNDLN